MAYTIPVENFSGKVQELVLGSDGREVRIGGGSALPFHTFEGEAGLRPAVAMEIQDVPPADWPDEVRQTVEGVSDDPARWARHCQDELGARMVALRLVGTHPDREDRSVEEAVATVKAVMEAVEVPLIILGSNHVEKDAQVLVAAAEAASGRNCVIGKAQEANYKTIVAAALAHNHSLIAMSELDINLAKQLNILITQMGFSPDRVLTDPMCSALGYGIEYTYSVMERIRHAALAQNDTTMQPPIVADVGMYVWKIKEVMAPEADMPEWGGLTERGIAWETVTATTLMLSGANLVILRHPKTAEAVEKILDELV